MTIRKPDGTSVMDFYLCTQDPSIYWLSAQVVKSKNTLSALVMSSVGYDLWHQCLGHPSPDVLRQVPRHTVGGLDQLLIPTTVPICKGCIQGKMTRSSFPDSSTCAKEIGRAHV